jgi:hypothetical protein
MPMKLILYVCAVLVALGAKAQVTNTPPAREQPSTQTELAARPLETLPQFTEQKPNEIRAGRLTLEGITVEAVKTDNPLQLLNPFAPSQYGEAEDNVLRDPISGRISGLKLFSVRF